MRQKNWPLVLYWRK